MELNVKNMNYLKIENINNKELMNLSNESFLEKYRPTKKEDLVGNEINKERIFSQLEQGKLVNMILTGKPGNGKTSTANIIAKTILGKTYGVNCITINCSDKTGVDNIRKKIIDVAGLKPSGSDFRIFILEESDELSNSAQDALRKPMEYPYDKHNKFIYLCNNLAKITPAIKDRCRIFHYMPIKPEEMIDRLKKIRDEENIDMSDDLVMKLAEMTNGSMRFPVIRLEEFKSLKRKIEENDLKLSEEYETIKIIFMYLKEKKIPIARDKTLDLYQKGFHFNDIVEFFHNFTIDSLEKYTNEINYRIKAKVLIKIAEAERAVIEGCNEFLQLSFLLSNISLLLIDTKRGSS